MDPRVDRLCVALTGQAFEVVVHQLSAIASNLVTWFLVLIGWRKHSLRLTSTVRGDQEAAILCLSPGGFERLSLTPLDRGVATVGYNVDCVSRLPMSRSLALVPDIIPPGHVVVRTRAFSINYADITIRWGLYESAIKFVGYPICPGFDFAGIVERAGAGAEHLSGQPVFGISFFGAYSQRILVPARQVRSLPKGVGYSEAAALPCGAGTALHALKLAGFWPAPLVLNNRAVLVHSAAGGVGSMLVQSARLRPCLPSLPHALTGLPVLRPP